MDSLEKTALATLICHTERFSKSGIRIYNYKVQDATGRKTRKRKRRRRRGTQAIANRYAFQANAKMDYGHLQKSCIKC